MRVAGIKKGRNGEPRQAKQALLMTQKFVLPRPSRERIIEAAGLSSPPPPPSLPSLHSQLVRVWHVKVRYSKQK